MCVHAHACGVVCVCMFCVCVYRREESITLKKYCRLLYFSYLGWFPTHRIGTLRITQKSQWTCTTKHQLNVSNKWFCDEREKNETSGKVRCATIVKRLVDVTEVSRMHGRMTITSTYICTLQLQHQIEPPQTKIRLPESPSCREDNLMPNWKLNATYRQMYCCSDVRTRKVDVMTFWLLRVPYSTV